MKKKILVINTSYRNFSGEDSNIIPEVNFLRNYFDVEYLEFTNKNNITFMDLIGFITSNNLTSNKKLQSTIDSFNPDIAYVHNTWFRANLGIFKILNKNNIKTLNKVHNYRVFCGSYLLSKSHLKESEVCLSCGLKKARFQLFSFYYKNSILKSLILFKYTKKYLKILKSQNIDLLVLSKFQKLFYTNLGVSKEKISIYPNPINIDSKNFNTYDSSSKYVVFAGRLIDSKGIIEIIDAWKYIKPINLTLKIIGEGELKYQIEKKLNSHIEYLGLLPNERVQEVIKKSRAVIIAPKIYEGQPRVMFEASSFGVPTIAPSFGGINEFFPDDYKLLFSFDNQNTLKEKLTQLDDSDFLNSQSSSIVDFLKIHYNEKRQINLFNKIINT